MGQVIDAGAVLCQECGKWVVQPEHLRCVCGGTVNLYRHYHGQSQRVGYCGGEGGCRNVRWNVAAGSWVLVAGGTCRCSKCGYEYPANGRGKTYCPYCKNPSSDVHFPTCPNCGEVFCLRGKPRPGWTRRYCSGWCRKAFNDAERKRKARAARNGEQVRKNRRGKGRQRDRDRQAVLARAYRQGWKCHQCRKLMTAHNPGHSRYATKDHVTPVSAAPHHPELHDDKNWVVVCFECNSRRRDVGPIQLDFEHPGLGF